MPLNLPREGTREHQVLERLCTGSSNKEIARDLGISPRTVEIHRMHALRRIGAKNSVHAVTLVLEARIRDLEQQLAEALAQRCDCLAVGGLN